MQFSSRDYKGKNQLDVVDLRISSWASKDPADSVFPPSFRQQAEHCQSPKVNGAPQKPHNLDTNGHAHEHQEAKPKSRKRHRDREDGYEEGSIRQDRKKHRSREDYSSNGFEARSPRSHGPPPPLPPARSSDRHRRESYDHSSARSHRYSRDSDHRASHHSRERYRDERSDRHSARSPGASRRRNDSRPPDARRSGDRTRSSKSSTKKGVKLGLRQSCLPNKAANEKNSLDLFISAGFGQGFAAAPKVLGDLFESIVGAVYIDSGGDLEVLWQVRIASLHLVMPSQSSNLPSLESH